MAWLRVILFSVFLHFYFLYSPIACFIVEEALPVDKNNPLITHWNDEDKMRGRMSNYADQKFSKQYHHYPEVNVSSVPPKRAVIARKKREALVASLATAVVTGMIGMTAKAVSDLTTFHPMPSRGGCEWFGTAPLCNFPCPPEFDYIRPHNGRCSSFWFSSLCKPDPSFGEPCSTVLGGYFKKRFCCKSDPSDCTWSGRWMGANTAYNTYCRYDNSVGLCGEITCSINHFEMKATASSFIGGERCDEITMFNATGRATCGFVAWYDKDGEVVNSWYKTS